ncbi:MAG: hypothetical protein QXQ57_01525 [Sulfolobales archaeon]
MPVEYVLPCGLERLIIAPADEEVFAILGEDRILYIPIDSDIGKEYAVRVVKGGQEFLGLHVSAFASIPPVRLPMPPAGLPPIGDTGSFIG